MKKGAACTVVFPIYDADGDLVPTAADLDSEYSVDGGNFGNCTNEAANITSGGVDTGIYSLSLVAAETNGDVVCIQVKTSTAGAKTTVLVFYTATQTLDETDAIIDNIHNTDLPDVHTDVADVHLDVSTVHGNVINMNSNVTDLMADVGDASASTLGSIYDILGNPAADSLTTTIEALSTTLSLAAVADAVLNEVVDANNPANANSLREVVNVMSAVLAGKSSGGGTDAIKFRDLGDTKDRTTATVDADGNRTAITNDGT